MKNPFDRWLSPDLDPEIVEALDDLPEGELTAHPGLEPGQARRVLSLARRLHRASCIEVTGVHHLPMGPAVLVANQSGQFPLDALSIVMAALLYASPPRLLRLLRPGGGSSSTVTSLLARAGVNLPVVYEAGGAALLRDGHALLTFPERAADATPERLASTLERGNKALGVMNRRLAETPFFAGSAYSVADIALYAYTHTAEEGGFQIAAYPAVADWLKRVEADPGHVPMDWLPN